LLGAIKDVTLELRLDSASCESLRHEQAKLEAQTILSVLFRQFPMGKGAQCCGCSLIEGEHEQRTPADQPIHA
jgi:hypothetical protein